MTLKEWLNSAEKNYLEGLKLLREHSGDAVLLGVLSAGETYYNKKRLLRELEVLRPKFITPLPKIVRKEKPKADDTPQQYGRKKREDYPVELHPAFDRQNELYKMVNYNHNRLDMLHELNQGKCAEACKAIVKGWREINAIYRVLDYWTENKVIIPNKWKPVDRSLPTDRAELVRLRNNIRVQISRYKNRPEKVVQVQAWKDDIEEIEVILKDV